MTKNSTNMGIIGGGAWGTALAQVFALAERSVLLWAREPEVVQAINTRHENTPFLAGIPLAPGLKATSDLFSLTGCSVILVVTPTQFLRSTLTALADFAARGQPLPQLVLCCKGVELGTGLLPSQILESVLPGHAPVILTGPTFAAEIARGQPAAVTLAAADRALAAKLQHDLSTKTFRAYASDDVIGAQIGAALKNVIAIACGIVHGRRLGESARAAIIARGLAEMARLCVALGGRRETLMGLCGVGDLTLTCSSMQSRNFSLGAAMGEGHSVEDILGPRKAVTEGVFTALAALELAARTKTDLPIIRAVNDCLNNGLSVDKAIETLLNRPVKEEIDP